MKKFLFTLATLCVAFGAFALDGPKFVFDMNEVELGAGESQEIVVILNTNDDLIKGCQAQWTMTNPAGELIAPEVCGLKKAYGPPRNPYMFDARGITIESGASVSSTIPVDGPSTYRVLVANTATGECWYPGDDAYQSALPQPVFAFTVAVGEGWEDEYANLTYDPAYSRYVGPSDLYFITGEDAEALNLVIRNKDYVPVGPATLSGEIIIGDADENGYVTIEYTGDEDVTIRVMVDGVYVPMTDGQIFLGAYGEAEVTVEVTAEGYEPMTASKTVNWEEPVLEDLEGEIVIDGPDENGVITVNYTGSEDVTITVTVNGEVVEGEIVLPEGDNVVEVTVEAAGYNTLTKTETITYTAPVPEEKTATPVITYEEFEDAVVVTATGDGEVLLYVNGEPVENPYTILKGEEAVTYTVTATAQEPGKAISETATLELTVDAAPAAPYETPAPTVTSELTDEAVVFTATGEGTVTLYIQYIDNETGDLTLETYEGEGTVSHEVARGEEDTYVNVWAAAVANEEAVPGVSAVDYYVLIPALEEVPPMPEEGVYLILIDQYGTEHPIKLNEGADGDYTTTVTLEYNPWGEFYWDPTLSDAENEENRPNVPFYFIINGVVYSAAEGLVPTFLGDAMQNPLTVDGEGYYTVPVGRSYTLGVAFKNDVYYVYAAKAKETGVDELVNGKTVAGVRYFNLAGQEMQEANGVTIVVTTYTDGTTSAVKVMK